MDAEKITRDLNRRFAAPLPEFYRRRIIVWHDEEGEFRDKLDEIVLDDAKIVALTGSNNFAVKKQITYDDVTSNIVLYDPCSYNRYDDNWLLDVELYSEEFRADLIAMWMEEMKLESSDKMRQRVKLYQKFFQAKSRRERIAKMEAIPASPAALSLAVMSAIAGIKETKPDAIIRTVLCNGLYPEENEIYSDYVTYGVDEAFWEMVAQGTGYREASNRPSLRAFFEHVVIMAFSRNYMGDLPGHWELLGTDRNKAYCYDLVDGWLHSDKADVYARYMNLLETELGAADYFMKQQINDLLDVECFNCINEVILTRIMKAIEEERIDAARLKYIIGKRRVLIGYEDYRNIYEGIEQYANMQEFYHTFASGFHFAHAKDLWAKYTEIIYKFDQYYRLFHEAYERYLMKFDPALNDLYRCVVEKVERLYNNWFLQELGTNWTNISEEEMRVLGRIEGIPQQLDFYKRNVKTAENRVFVVISDALRYEVAAQLYDVLSCKQQSKVKISSQQAFFPTKTKYGMAALLPNRGLTLSKGNNEVKVLINNKCTDAANRENILKEANPDSCVLKYDDIIAMKSAERSELVRGKKIVYIYHDTIDKASHKSDTDVFDACSKTVTQLSNLVDIMVRDFKALNILVTADHGFLYTYSDLKESDRLESAEFMRFIVEYGRRFALLCGEAKPEHLMQVKLQTVNEDYSAYAPKENVRIKSGGGMKFVHGGASLQELVVPIVEYTHVNAGTKEYMRNRDIYDTKPVGLSLLSSNRIISNQTFTLEYYQTEPIGSARTKGQYTVCFVDEFGEAISDTQKIIADRQNENGQDRIFRVAFTLKAGEYNKTKSYYMITADENGIEVNRYEYEIRVASGDMDENDYFM